MKKDSEWMDRVLKDMDREHLKRLIGELVIQSREGSLSCARAHEAAQLHEATPEQSGAAMDREGLEIVHCQLGLFGYGPDKKIVRPMESIPEYLAAQINDSLSGGKLTCREAWRIAAEMGIARIEVASACETMGVKISSCQLGAF